MGVAIQGLEALGSANPVGAAPQKQPEDQSPALTVFLKIVLRLPRVHCMFTHILSSPVPPPALSDTQSL